MRTVSISGLLLLRGRTTIQNSRCGGNAADAFNAILYLVRGEFTGATLVAVHQVELVAVLAATSLATRVLVALTAAFPLILDGQQGRMTGHHIQIVNLRKEKNFFNHFFAKKNIEILDFVLEFFSDSIQIQRSFFPIFKNRKTEEFFPCNWRKNSQKLSVDHINVLKRRRHILKRDNVKEKGRYCR
jgi:hypothetical protein